MHLYYWMCSSTALQVASASIQIRSARPNDIPYMRKINIKTLPENYTPEWWDHHLASWPQMTLVAEHSEPDQQSVIVGYALGQIQVGLPMAQLLLQLSAIRLL
jgi:ribosomal protein S18 acetylase RimI-like enzyme